LSKDEKDELRAKVGRSFLGMHYIPRQERKAALAAKKERIRAKKEAAWAARNPEKAARKAEKLARDAAKAAAKAQRDRDREEYRRLEAAEKEARRVANLPPVVVRKYADVYGQKAGHRLKKPASEFFEEDARTMVADGYTVMSVEHTGNKTSKSLLFGAAGYFAPDEITVTYVRQGQ
jgi:hypothetical protein